MHTRNLLAVFVSAVLVGGLSASPPAPPPPAEYDVIIRYRIDALRTERIVQFREMVRYLESIGFKKDPSENENEEEDPAVTRMSGSIASANARKILNERHVRTIMLIPRGAKLPAEKEAAQLLRVDLEIASGYRPELQQRLYEQTRRVLRDLGFQEAVGYDNHGQKRFLGNIAAQHLETLLRDLRETPAGSREPNPFQGVTPIHVVDVQPQMELVKPLPGQREIPVNQAKIAPDLRSAGAAKEEDAKEPDAKEPATTGRRVEIILWTTPSTIDRAWQDTLRQAAPDLMIEGQLGPVVSGSVLPDRIPALAAMPMVSGIRLPRPAALTGIQSPRDGKEALDALGVERLHRLGYRGRGTRIAVIDSDFRGYQELVKAGRLPARTSLIDLTAERSFDLMPDALPKSAGLGHGTRCALAAGQAAPEAELILLRVDPAAPYQVLEAARYIRGDGFVAPSLDQRASELLGEGAVLRDRREKLLEERRFLLEGDLPFEEFQAKWADYKGRQDAFDREEKAHEQRGRRYLELRDALLGLKGVQVVASSLVWNEGYPVDGSGALSRYLDDRPCGGALWFQAAGDTSGQAWAGLFRDGNGNGTMEFATRETPLPPERWTPELNFLGWRGDQGSPSLPNGARVRITLQWHEAHDPEFFRRGEDVYRVPLADLRLLVLRQRDPSGSKLPADEMEVIAQSERLPQRIDNQPSAATYEHTVEFTVPADGRYAVMVLGRPPRTSQPGNQVIAPGRDRTGELRSRIFVDTVSGTGRAVLADFTGDSSADNQEEGSLGMPGDARGVVTVGSADGGGLSRFSPRGPAFNLRLLPKPDVLVYDRLRLPDGGLDQGASVATGFAAGLAASALSAGAPREKFLQVMQAPPGGVLRVPAEWSRPTR